MTTYEKQRYLETTTDKGNKRYVEALAIPRLRVSANGCVPRLDFRFSH